MRSSQAALGDIFIAIRNGKSIKQSKSVNGVPITRIETIWNAEIDPARVGYASEGLEGNDDFLLRPGDILFSHINSVEHIGKCALYEGSPPHLIHGMNLLRLQPDPKRVDPAYAKYALRTEGFRAQLLRYVNKAVNQASVSASNLKTLTIPLPPLTEQKRIAAILDQADSLRRLRRHSIDRLNALAQSVFYEMFGTWHGDSRFPLTDLGDYLDFLTSGSRGWAEYYSDSGAKFIRIQNVKRDSFDETDMAFVQAPSTAEAKRTRVHAGDVLLSITADLGRTAVVPDNIGEGYINQHLAILRTSRFNSQFLSSALASKSGQTAILKKDRVGVKSGLNFDDVRSVRLINPPRLLQDRYSRVVDSIRDTAGKLSAHESLLERNFSSLQQRAFRGEL